jgi:hypothetical protein
MAIKEKYSKRYISAKTVLRFITQNGDLVQGIEKEYCFRIYLKIICSLCDSPKPIISN